MLTSEGLDFWAPSTAVSSVASSTPPMSTITYGFGTHPLPSDRQYDRTRAS